MIRKATSIILIAALLAVFVYAGDSDFAVTISCGGAVTSGSTLECTVTVKNNGVGSGIFGGDIYISYDSDLLKFVGTDKQSAPGDKWVSELYGDDTDLLHIGFYDDDFIKSIPVGSEASCTVIFKALETTSDKTAALTISKCSFLNGLYDEIKSGSLGSAQVKITGSSTGIGGVKYASAITVTGVIEPEVGKAPSFTAATGSGAEIVEVTWTPSDSVFKASTAYSVTAKVKLTDGTHVSDSTTASINGIISKLEKLSDTEAQLTYTFPNTPAADELSGDDTKAEETKKTEETQKSEKDTEAQAPSDSGETGGNTSGPSNPDTPTAAIPGIDEPDELFYGDFIDVRMDAWYVDYVAYVYDRGFFKGVSDTSFAPELTMTRAMFVTVLGRIAGIDPALYTKIAFDDVETGSWYAPYVQWASENGIVEGMGDGIFAPDSPVTREQICTLLSRYIVFADIVPKSSTNTVFTDESAISSWALESVKLCASQRLIQGYEDGTFLPQNNATRAEVATIITRLCKIFGI